MVANILSKLRNNILGKGQSSNINYGGGTKMAREAALGIADTSPTARLNKDPLGFSSLSYPRDLINDVTNGHYMLFYVNVQNKTKFPYTKAKDGVDIGGTITVFQRGEFLTFCNLSSYTCLVIVPPISTPSFAFV